MSYRQVEDRTTASAPMRETAAHRVLDDLRSLQNDAENLYGQARERLNCLITPTPEVAGRSGGLDKPPMQPLPPLFDEMTGHIDAIQRVVRELRNLILSVEV